MQKYTILSTIINYYFLKIFDILSKGIVIGGFRREEHSLENIFMKITEEADAERRNAYDQTVQQPNN